MRKPNGDFVATMSKVIEINEDLYLLRDAWVNTDEEYYEDGSELESLDIDDLVVESGDAVAVTIASKENGIAELEVLNVVNQTMGRIYTSSNLYDDGRYYTIHRVAHIFRERGLRDVSCYFYLWRTKEEIEDYYDMMQSYIDLED